MCIYIQFEVLSLFSVQTRKTTRLFFVGTQAVEAIEEAKAARAAKAMVKKVPNPDVHPRNLTWNLKIMVSKWTFLLQGLIFRFHVKFRGCKSQKNHHGNHRGFLILSVFFCYFHKLKLQVFSRSCGKKTI